MATISIEQAKRRITFAANELVREVFAEEAKRVIQRTPVVSGNTRANWIVGLGRKSRAKPKLRKRDPSGQATLQVAIAKVRKGKVRKKTFFTNAVPWILALEYGTRDKANPAKKDKRGRFTTSGRKGTAYRMMGLVRAAHPRIARMVAARVKRKAQAIK